MKIKSINGGKPFGNQKIHSNKISYSIRHNKVRFDYKPLLIISIKDRIFKNGNKINSNGDKPFQKQKIHLNKITYLICQYKIWVRYKPLLVITLKSQKRVLSKTESKNISVIQRKFRNYFTAVLG